MVRVRTSGRGRHCPLIHGRQEQRKTLWELEQCSPRQLTGCCVPNWPAGSRRTHRQFAELLRTPTGAGSETYSSTGAGAAYPTGAGEMYPVLISGVHPVQRIPCEESGRQRTHPNGCRSNVRRCGSLRAMSHNDGVLVRHDPA